MGLPFFKSAIFSCLISTAGLRYDSEENTAGHPRRNGVSVAFCALWVVTLSRSFLPILGWIG